jgi:hypothetical protein
MNTLLFQLNNKEKHHEPQKIHNTLCSNTGHYR